MTIDIFNKLLPILSTLTNEKLGSLINVEDLKISINNEPIMYIKTDADCNGDMTIHFISGIIGGKHTITYQLK